LGLLERIGETVAARGSRRSSLPAPVGRATLADWVNMFTFDGVQYPLLSTSMGSIDEEKIAHTASAAHKTNGIIFALVVARLQVFSQARFQWTRFEGGMPARMFGTPELRILERPWHGGTTGDLLARMEIDASLAGNCYIRRVRNRLHRLRPEWVAILLGSGEDADHPAEAGDVDVAGYVYMPPNSRPLVLLPEEVAHYAPIPDPDLNFLGMSWITPVIRDVQADSAQVEHKRRFLSNAATPNMVVKFDPMTTLEQARKFKEVFNEDHVGWHNAYRTLFLLGGADLQVVGKDFQQLDFAATQGKGESRLAAAAGVPPSWVGFSEGLQGSSLNAGNFTAARRRYADGTLIHLWMNAAASLETIVPPPPGAYLWPDTRAVPFMREDAKDAAEIQHTQAVAMRQLAEAGYDPTSARDAIVAHDWTVMEHTGRLSVQLHPTDELAGGGGGGVSGDAAARARELTEMLQKIYVATPGKTVISQREAREILNRAGAGLDLSADELLPVAASGGGDASSGDGDGS